MYNTQAAIFAQSTMEIRRLIQALGGKEEAVSWLPGAGDLYVTVFGGRTRRLGVLIGQGHRASEALEIMAGVTLESVEIIARAAQAVERLGSRGVSPGQFPLLRFLNGVVHQDQPVRFPWETFFSRWKDRFELI
jgi:glycerol-3-phosphate dehydrogenase (NAD(P)+)